MMRVSTSMCACLALLVLASGCSQAKGPAKRDTMEAIVGRKGGHPTVRIGGITIVFESIISQGADNSAIGTFVVQVRGKQKAAPAGDASSRFEDVQVSTSYAEGTADISVNGQKFRVIDSGDKVQFTDSRYPLHAGAKSVLVAQDGSTSLSR